LPILIHHKWQSHITPKDHAFVPNPISIRFPHTSSSSPKHVNEHIICILNTAVQPHSKNIKTQQNQTTPVHVTWQFTIAARRFVTEPKKWIRDGCVAWQSILSRQAVSGQRPELYKIHAKMIDMQWSSRRIVPEQ